MASLHIKYKIKQILVGSYKQALFLGFISISVLFAKAQNMHLTGGGITVGTGATINIVGSVTVGNTSTVTNNSSIILTGNWTNNGGTYTGSTGTVSFKGAAAQAINGTASSHTFNHVVINQSPAATVDMNAAVNVANLTFTSGKLSIGSNTLGIGGTITNSVTGGLKGSSSSSITIAASNAAGTMSFDQTTLGTTNVLRNLTLNTSASTSIGNVLNLAAGTTTAPGTLTLANGAVLTTNDILTLKSNASGTSRVAEIPVNGSGVAQATITGKVTVERWVSSRRAWRLICVPVQNTGVAETSIWNAWQEGANNTVDLTTGGSYSTDNNDPNPGFGTHVTCDKGIYNSTTDGFDAASRFNASLLTHNGTDWGGRPLNTKSTYITSQPGWMIFVRGSRAVNLSLAQYATSDVTVLRPKGLLMTGRQTTTTVTNPSGYNLINNPYASGIDLTQCTLNGSAISTIGYYLWDPYILGTFTTVGGYTLYDPILGFMPTPVSPIVANRIEAGSAFFVQSSSGQTLIIPEVSKVANNSQVLRPMGNPSHYQKMKTTLFIDLNGQTAQADACGQVLDADFSNSFSFDEDKLKMYNFSENLFIRSNNKKLAVEYRKPYTENDTVFYTINRMGIKNYHFSFEPGNMEASNLSAMLEDNFTGTKTPISLAANTVVHFSVTADSLSSAANRFQMVFKPIVVLPVTFSSIKATLQATATNGRTNDILVQWTVQNAINISAYVVEKSSDGRNFVPVNTLAANGNGGSVATYNLLDVNTITGNNFYRIRSIGVSGEYTYSQVVKINIGATKSGISVFPNPVTNNTIFLQMNEVPYGVYNVALTSNNGQLIQSTKLVQNSNNSTTTIQPTKVLPSGTYQLKVTGPDKKISVIQLEVHAN
jgi:hypothetical protein